MSYYIHIKTYIYICLHVTFYNKYKYIYICIDFPEQPCATVRYPIEKHILPQVRSFPFWGCHHPGGHVNVFWRLPACAYCLPPLWHFEVGRSEVEHFLHRKFQQIPKMTWHFYGCFEVDKKNTSNMIRCFYFFQTPNRLLFGELENRDTPM